MPQEYITTSKAAVMNMANHLDKKEGEGEKMELMRDNEKEDNVPAAKSREFQDVEIVSGSGEYQKEKLVLPGGSRKSQDEETVIPDGSENCQGIKNVSAGGSSEYWIQNNEKVIIIQNFKGNL